MNTAIRLHNVTKNYDTFTLDHVSMEVPRGSIVGLVGENGAGKTTIIKSALQMISIDEGEIFLDEKPIAQLPDNWKKDVGIILGGIDFAAFATAGDMEKILTGVYDNWDSKVYNDYLRRFKIDINKKVKDYSKGMKMKLCIAMALSHNAKTLIFDEATSGLDPIVRDDILDILLEFIQDENHSVLISSHITSDLEKVADYIVFLHEGRICLSMNKGDMLYKYGVVKCSRQQYENLPGKLIKGVRRGQFGYEVLVEDREKIAGQFPDMVVERSSIEEIVLFMVKGERV